ncbi:OmpA family protein [Pseudooctadecabacter jejudonensis]|uniref:Outer membrane porin F n=1 Tax=Pseudooctadecabacter jejudonensis TaxID=1391910 RepID=A0A1Y5SU15_9RHOB|nr:OmpA family protein [Pseudooctadecabacter jejudonensis]SLN45069.1 Outer membrane porin F precursor [Pseudooctadecabacter jejudonensis]
MTSKFLTTLQTGLGVALAGAIALATPVSAQQTITGQSYEPTIWVDPDGCTHWVMDDGFEGYMSPRRNRDGSPICMRSEICGIVPTDTLFENDEPWISNADKQRLMAFFQQADAFGFLIYGHTDSNASDEYNMRLSNQRANMVAGIAQDTGARVVDVRGFGERRPRADNHTHAGRAENRRVEIYCIR